jgi:uncharacterized repeat protein (TIGR02543 family)
VAVSGSGSAWKFTMPAAHVRVSAEFEGIPYAVTIANSLANGGITPSHATAAVGTTITLTISPAAGYGLKPDSLTISPDSGGPVTAQGGGNLWTFAMPAANVGVSAEFAAAQPITIAAMTNGAVVPNLKEAATGALVTLTVTPEAGYALKPDSLTANGSAVTVSGNTGTFAMPGVAVTVSAEFVVARAVSFHANGGSPAPAPQSVPDGGKATEPAAMIRQHAEGLYLGAVDLSAGPVFDGWYKEEALTTPWNFAADTVTADTELYAKWTGPSPVDVSGQIGAHVLAKALFYINAQTLSVPTNYTVVLDGNYAMLDVPWSSTPPLIDNPNAVITLIGKNPVVISLFDFGGNVFRILAGELILDNNITLKGRSDNNTPLVEVNGINSRLTLKAGAAITGNTNNQTSSDAEGGGVYVSNNGTFTMSGGTVSGNTAHSNTDGSHGGGVYVDTGTFTMSGGTITGNTASVNNDDGFATGGGVYVDDGTFTMSGGTISGNTAHSDAFGNGDGGGVYVWGTFTMYGGTISGNIASGTGGGVLVNMGPTILAGGTVSGNSASIAGGGLSIVGGTVAMSGGTISGNTASMGGGVVVIAGNPELGIYGGSFSKTGGTIYGDTDTNPTNGNATDNTATSLDGGGIPLGHAAIYAESPSVGEDGTYTGTAYYRNATLNAGDSISTDTVPANPGETAGNWTKR